MTPRGDAPVVSAGMEPGNVSRVDEIRPSASGAVGPVDSVARETRLRTAAAVAPERAPAARGTAVNRVTPVAPPSADLGKSESPDPFDANRPPGGDHYSKKAGPRTDAAGLASTPGTASPAAAGIASSSATSSPAPGVSAHPAGASPAVGANLAAGPANSAGTSAAAAAGVASAMASANPTGALAPTVDSPSGPMASPTAPSTTPAGPPGSPGETAAASPPPETDSKTNVRLATPEPAEPVSPAKTDSLIAETDARAKELASEARAKATEATAPANRASYETDETKADAHERRANPERADRERVTALTVSVASLSPGSRLAQHFTANLTRTVRVRFTPWRLQLLEDTILPTQPVRAGQVESVAALRQRLLAEQKARLPAALRESDVLNGVVLALPRELIDETMAWRDHTGAVADNSQVKNSRAEIVWTAENAPVEHPIRLMRANGDVVAEVRQEGATRELVVRTAEEVRTWLRWLVRAAEEEGPSERTSPRFSWRTSTGGPLPPGWEAGVEGPRADYRLDLPIGGAMGSVALHRYALFDRVSGWALVSELRQAADRPLSE